jgi:hypothetical protein
MQQDLLVSALLEKQRYINAKRARRLEIDNQFEFCGLLYWHLTKFYAQKERSDETGGAIRTVCHQAADISKGARERGSTLP